MNAAHLHLMFNHLSLVGMGFAILLNLLAVFGKSVDIRKLSCWFYILVGLLAILPVATGDGAGEIIKNMPGVSKDAIEYHETWGYLFFYGAMAIGLLAIAALWYTRAKEGVLKKFNLAMLVLAIVVSVFAFQTGTTGGKIRHSEIQLQH